MQMETFTPLSWEVESILTKITINVCDVLTNLILKNEFMLLDQIIGNMDSRILIAGSFID